MVTRLPPSLPQRPPSTPISSPSCPSAPSSLTSFPYLPVLSPQARGALLHHFSFKGPVAVAKFSPDGRYLAVGVGRLVQVWTGVCVCVGGGWCRCELGAGCGGRYERGSCSPSGWGSRC